MRQKIAEKMEELALLDKYRIVHYPALRKAFLDIPLKEFLDLLDSFHLGLMKRGSWEWAWRKTNRQPALKKLRNWHMKKFREVIEYAKKNNVWDGVTLREYIKYMSELEEERGTDYTSTHALIVYNRSRQ